MAFIATVAIVHFLYFCIADISYSEMNRYNSDFIYKARLSDMSDMKLNQKIGKIRVETAGNNFLIYFVFQREDGRYITDAHVILAMKNSTNNSNEDQWDFVTTLEEQKPGLYLTKLAKKYIGQWDIKIVATKDEEEFILQQRLVLHCKKK